jgi:hypothetical protein
LERFNEVDKYIAIKERVAAKFIKDILLEPEEKVNAVEVLGKNMAPYLTEVLENNQQGQLMYKCFLPSCIYSALL